MNNEIKEIDITKDLYLCSPLLNTKCSKTSCYINNGSCCHTVNKEYSQEHLLDYITNLQQELVKEKEEKESWQRVATKFFNNAEDYKARIDKAVEYLNGRSDE